jgi:hypothetical protein
VAQIAKTSFARDILPLFRPIDVEHMVEIVGLDLSDYAAVRGSADAIRDRLQRTGAGRMPPPPDQPWTKAQIDLFSRWITENYTHRFSRDFSVQPLQSVV